MKLCASPLVLGNPPSTFSLLKTLGTKPPNIKYHHSLTLGHIHSLAFILLLLLYIVPRVLIYYYFIFVILVQIVTTYYIKIK